MPHPNYQAALTIMNRFSEEGGFSLNEAQVLLALYVDSSNAILMSELLETLGINQSTGSRVISKLSDDSFFKSSRKKLIYKTSGKGGAKKTIALTEAGQELMKRVTYALTAHEDVGSNKEHLPPSKPRLSTHGTLESGAIHFSRLVYLKRNLIDDAIRQLWINASVMKSPLLRFDSESGECFLSIDDYGNNLLVICDMNNSDIAGFRFYILTLPASSHILKGYQEFSRVIIDGKTVMDYGHAEESGLELALILTTKPSESQIPLKLETDKISFSFDEEVCQVDLAPCSRIGISVTEQFCPPMQSMPNTTEQLIYLALLPLKILDDIARLTMSEKDLAVIQQIRINGGGAGQDHFATLNSALKAALELVGYSKEIDVCQLFSDKLYREAALNAYREEVKGSYYQIVLLYLQNMPQAELGRGA